MDGKIRPRDDRVGEKQKKGTIMGAWDHTSFGNDDACDWGGDLRDHDDLSLVEETMKAEMGGWSSGVMER